MKLITIQVTDSQMVEALDAVADLRGYKLEIDGKPNPQSKEDFAKEVIAADLNRYMANIYSNWLTQGIRQKSYEAAKSAFIVTVE